MYGMKFATLHLIVFSVFRNRLVTDPLSSSSSTKLSFLTNTEYAPLLSTLIWCAFWSLVQSPWLHHTVLLESEEQDSGRIVCVFIWQVIVKVNDIASIDVLGTEIEIVDCLNGQADSCQFWSAANWIFHKTNGLLKGLNRCRPLNSQFNTCVQFVCLLLWRLPCLHPAI